MKLNAEERYILSKLSLEALRFLTKVGGDQEFEVLKNVVNSYIDAEKDRFFGEKEYDPAKLATEHAYARGKTAGALQIIRLFVGAKHELDRREELRKKVRE